MEKHKPVLEIKPVFTEDPDSLRIYELAIKSVQNLNNYIADFIGSINIMKENRENFLRKKDNEKAEKILADMAFIESKIEEVSRSMKAISDVMPELVSYSQSPADGTGTD